MQEVSEASNAATALTDISDWSADGTARLYPGAILNAEPSLQPEWNCNV